MQPTGAFHICVFIHKINKAKQEFYKRRLHDKGTEERTNVGEDNPRPSGPLKKKLPEHT